MKNPKEAYHENTKAGGGLDVAQRLRSGELLQERIHKDPDIV
jgi:hypothetical protein